MAASGPNLVSTVCRLIFLRIEGATAQRPPACMSSGNWPAKARPSSNNTVTAEMPFSLPASSTTALAFPFTSAFGNGFSKVLLGAGVSAFAGAGIETAGLIATGGAATCDGTGLFCRNGWDGSDKAGAGAVGITFFAGNASGLASIFGGVAATVLFCAPSFDVGSAFGATDSFGGAAGMTIFGLSCCAGRSDFGDGDDFNGDGETSADGV